MYSKEFRESLNAVEAAREANIALEPARMTAEEKDKKKKKGASFAGFSFNTGMLKLAYGFTVKRAVSMMGGKFTKEEILRMNAILNKVKKKK